MKERHISFGDICRTRYWISFELHYWAWWRWFVSFGPTYNGTTHGVVVGLPCLVIIGHRRANT
jgi:hypothetical protein